MFIFICVSHNIALPVSFFIIYRKVKINIIMTLKLTFKFICGKLSDSSVVTVDHLLDLYLYYLIHLYFSLTGFQW